MTYQVRVQLKGADQVISPSMSRDEAEGEIAKIKAVLGSRDPEVAALGVPDVAWMTATGQNIIGADLLEVMEPFVG